MFSILHNVTLLFAVFTSLVLTAPLESSPENNASANSTSNELDRRVPTRSSASFTGANPFININCRQDLGTGIIRADCDYALRQMIHHTVNIGFTNNPLAGPFSRASEDPNFRLPMFFRTSTCTIGLDVVTSSDELQTNWRYARVTAAERLIDRCVNNIGTGASMGTGGELTEFSGFVTVVINEQNMKPDKKDTWKACLKSGSEPQGVSPPQATTPAPAGKGSCLMDMLLDGATPMDTS